MNQKSLSDRTRASVAAHAAHADALKLADEKFARDIAAAAVEVAASKPATVEVATVEVAADAPDISIVQISERLGFVVTRVLIEGLGIESNQGLSGGRIKWREADFRPICAALVKHIQGVAA